MSFAAVLSAKAVIPAQAEILSAQLILRFEVQVSMISAHLQGYSVE